MKLRWPIVLLSLTGVAAVGVILAWTFRTREPVYQGMPLGYWVGEFRSGNPKSRNDCQAAVQASGPNAIPYLMSLARRQDAIDQRLYRAVWPRLPGILKRRLRQPDPISYELHQRIGFLLGSIGEPAVPTLLRALQEHNAGARLAAVGAIRRIAPKSEPAVRLVVKLVDDPNRLTRLSAVMALERMKPNCAVAVPALVRALRDSDVGPIYSSQTITVRGYAAQVLGELGPEARDALPELRKVLDTVDPYARHQAAMALWRIGKDTNGIPVLVTELKRAIHPDAQTSFSPADRTIEVCLKGLAEIGPDAAASVPVILEMIEPAPRTASRGMQHRWGTIRLARETLDKVDPRFEQH